MPSFAKIKPSEFRLVWKVYGTPCNTQQKQASFVSIYSHGYSFKIPALLVKARYFYVEPWDFCHHRLPFSALDTSFEDFFLG